MTDAEEADMLYYDADEEESYLASTVRGRGNLERKMELPTRSDPGHFDDMCDCGPKRRQRSDRHKTERKGR